MNYNILSIVLGALEKNDSHCLDNQPERLSVAIDVATDLEDAGVILEETE